MVCGGALQIPFNGLQKTIGNLALGRLGAPEVTLQMADSASLSLRRTSTSQQGKH